MTHPGLLRGKYCRGPRKASGASTTKMLKGGAEIIARDRPRMAFSTEEPEDDPVVNTAAVKKIQPAYEVRCGPCLSHGHVIFTDVMSYR